MFNNISKGTARIWSDIRRGENIDLYTTVVISIGLVTLSLFGVPIEKWTASLTLVVLSLVAISSIGTRFRIEESLHCSKQQAEEITSRLSVPVENLLEKVVVSQALVGTGIKQVCFYTTELDWGQLFNKAEEIDLFLTYGRTWRANNFVYLDEFVRRKGTKLRVV